MPATKPQEIRAAFLDAFNRRDVDALVALYEPGALLVIAGGSAYGHEAIRERYQRTLTNGVRMELKTLAVSDSGAGLAVLHASWTYCRGNDRVSGLSTEVVRRQPDGTWLFVLDEPRARPKTQSHRFHLS